MCLHLRLSYDSVDHSWIEMLHGVRPGSAETTFSVYGEQSLKALWVWRAALNHSAPHPARFSTLSPRIDGASAPRLVTAEARCQAGQAARGRVTWHVVGVQYILWGQLIRADTGHPQTTL